MARKPKAQTPPKEDEHEGGFPQHGDPAPMDPVDGDEGGDDDEEEDEGEPEPKGETADQKVARLEAEMADLRRRIPPTEVKAPPPPKEDEEPDWDKMLYDNPKEAMRLHGERVAARVKADLTRDYQKEQGTKVFWDKFYDKNKDLKQDQDLVETTLKSNLNDLANIPVEDAMKKLADLTRDRIMRYAGGKPKGGGKKAVAEGSSPPSAPRATPEPDAPSSLSDIIKARARKRRGQVAA
jgi:hypothetical protein